MPRLPEHLQRRDGIYHFRMRVPDNLQAEIGKREFRQSLRTSSLEEAKRKVALQRLQANAQLEAARRSKGYVASTDHPVARDFTDDDLWSLMAAWFVKKQKDDAGLGMDEVRPAERLEELAYATDPDDTNFSSAIRSTTLKFLAQQRVKLDPGSDAFRRLSALIHEAWIEREKRLIRRFIGDGTIGLNPRFTDLQANTDLHPGAKLTFADLVIRYEADRSQADVAPKTK